MIFFFNFTALENEHQSWLNAISQTASDLNPIGKTPAENMDNDTDDEDQDGKFLILLILVLVKTVQNNTTFWFL